LIASLLGYAACLCALSVANMIATSNDFRISALLIVLAYEAVFSAPACIVGWLVFLLPVAFLYGRKKMFQQTFPMCAFGILAGVLLTCTECALVFRDKDPAVYLMFVPCGLVNAAVATVTLVARRRRRERQHFLGA
jgi:hypothetical protein